MHFTSDQPVIIVTIGHYKDRADRNKPMLRQDGSIVEYIEVIGVAEPLGTQLTQIPCGPGLELHKHAEGSQAVLTLHVRTESKAMMGRNGTPYTATQTKLRVVGLEVVSGAPAKAA